MTRALIPLVLFVLHVLPCVAEPVFETDAMTDDELRRYRDQKIAELKRRAHETKPEKTADGTVYRIFFCTIYYTPKETGFTAERGFDATPVIASGLGGRKYPRAFLSAVKKEGFGRMAAPVNGRNYMRYAGNGRYAFAKEPLGNRGNVLVPRQTAAISSRNPHLRRGREIELESPTIQAVFGTTKWLPADTGGGVRPLQIDLYWGEDEPMGPVGRQSARPRGTRMEYAFDVAVKLKH